MNQQHRRSRRWLWYTAGAFFFVAGGVAVALFSPIARISEIEIQGARSVDITEARTAVTLGSEHRLFGRAYNGASLVGFDVSKGREHLLAAFPQIADAVVTRIWPHRVSVVITERTPRGIWCRPTGAASTDFMCRFWDDHGVRWGTAMPSTGSLLLQIRDERADESIDDGLLKGILTAVDGIRTLGLRARKVTLPDAEPGGMRVEVGARYELYVDALADVEGQLDTLGVFLADRAKDSSFAPSYIDLRTPGRIYYK